MPCIADECILHSLICCPIFDLSGCFPLVRSGPVASAAIIIGIEYVFCVLASRKL